MKLDNMSVSPQLDTKILKKHANDMKKYKKTIQGTSNRFLDISSIVRKAQDKSLQYSGSNLHRLN